MRLIDVDAFIEEARSRIDMQEMYLPIHIKEMVLDELPTVDAVPVIRCKDCRYYLNSSEKCGLVDTRLQFYSTGKTWTENDFCSWAERKDE